jgi:hypothetical protein
MGQRHEADLSPQISAEVKLLYGRCCTAITPQYGRMGPKRRVEERVDETTKQLHIDGQEKQNKPLREYNRTLK